MYVRKIDRSKVSKLRHMLERAVGGKVQSSECACGVIYAGESISGNPQSHAYIQAGLVGSDIPRLGVAGSVVDGALFLFTTMSVAFVSLCL